MDKGSSSSVSLYPLQASFQPFILSNIFKVFTVLAALPVSFISFVFLLSSVIQSSFYLKPFNTSSFPSSSRAPSSNHHLAPASSPSPVPPEPVWCHVFTQPVTGCFSVTCSAFKWARLWEPEETLPLKSVDTLIVSLSSQPASSSLIHAVSSADSCLLHQVHLTCIYKVQGADQENESKEDTFLLYFIWANSQMKGLC